MSNILLTAEERHRFASWLEYEVQTSKGIVEQLRKLGPTGELMIHNEEREAQAALIVARKIRSIQDQTIG